MNFRNKQNLIFFLKIFLGFTIFLFLMSLCTNADAVYIPALNNQQITVATMGHINEKRYTDQHFDFSVSFLQTKLTENIKMTFITRIGNNEADVGAFSLLPLIKDRLYAIAGGSYGINGASHAGGGFQLFLGESAAYVKQLGENEYMGGFLIPFADNMFHAGLNGSYEKRDHGRPPILMGGIMLGFNFGALGKEERDNWKKLLPVIPDDTKKIPPVKEGV